MVKNTKKRELARIVVNCTKEEFYTYDSLGSVVKIAAGDGNPLPDEQTFDTVYIVTGPTYKDTLGTGRGTYDLCYTRDLGVGPDKVELRSIHPYDEPDARVSPHPETFPPTSSND